MPKASGGPITPSRKQWIIHVDLDAFFASVEELLDPTLRGKPLVVGGSPQGRGVVASASYAARAFGIRSAMPVAQALRLCPHLIVLRHHFDEYAKRSAAVMAMLREITPAVEQISIDEAFLDVTGCEALWGSVEQIARRIQSRVMDELSLPVSLGVASNKLVAKIACDVGKPQGLVVVPQGQEAAFLAPLPIERLWGVGRVTGARLRALGIQTIGDLAHWDMEALERVLGQSGQALRAAAQGRDDSAVHEGHERRSISQERTFAHDIAEAAELRRTLLAMSDDLAARLRQQHLVAQGVRIKMRTPDFRTVTRQVSLSQPTDQAGIIYQHAEELLRRHWRVGQPLRLLGLAVSNLLDGAGYQLGLFSEQDRRNIRLSRTLDEIRERFGPEAVTRASLLRRRAGR